MPALTLQVVLLGKVGVGKSASGNTILGRKGFTSKKSSKGVTLEYMTETEVIEGINVVVYDTPGFCDPDHSDEDTEQRIREGIFEKKLPSPRVFLLLVRIDRFTKEEKSAVISVERLLGEASLEQTWILFTRGDELDDDQTIEDYISESEDLQQVMSKYGTRYHVFDNKNGNQNQAKSLLEKIRPDYFVAAEQQRSTPISNDASEKRFILLGKSGVGKSATGNTILGREYFKSEISASSVTQSTQVGRTNVDGRNICVVDTPGLFDTTLTPEALVEEIARSIYECTPGPHAFLIVLPINNRFTEQEKKIIEHYKKIFGPQLEKHAIVLFTHGDQLKGKTVKLLLEENSDLKKVVEQCGGRYQLFNNEDTRNRAQVNQLMQKVDSMLQSNGGSQVKPLMQNVDSMMQSNGGSQVKPLMQKVDSMMQSNGGSFYTSQMFEEAKQSGWQTFWDWVKPFLIWLFESFERFKRLSQSLFSSKLHSC